MSSKVDSTYKSEEKGILDNKMVFYTIMKTYENEGRKKNRWYGIL